jgi:hypothetical protein
MVKNKAIPITGRGGVYVCWMLKFPHCLDNCLTDGGGEVSLRSRKPFISQEDSSYIFLFEDESISDL